MFHWDMPRVFGYPFGFMADHLCRSIQNPCAITYSM
ncbi:unnamed protein product [Brassica rapa subsp. narinosa]